MCLVEGGEESYRTFQSRLLLVMYMAFDPTLSLQEGQMTIFHHLKAILEPCMNGKFWELKHDSTNLSEVTEGEAVNTSLRHLPLLSTRL
jgi:hypothetical protein